MKLEVSETLRNASIKLSPRGITIRYIPSPGKMEKLKKAGKDPSLLLLIQKDGKPAVIHITPIRDTAPIEFSVPAPEPPYEVHLLLTVSP